MTNAASTSLSLTYASVCDGIGAAHVAWQPLGWRCAWVSEIDRFCNALCEQRWGFPNLGDMLAITEEQLAAHGHVNLLVGGTPCQSFSIAGLRGGLADPRGNLALRFCQLAGIMRPEWVVWENVPGVLSSGKGEDFGSIVRGLEELGYGVAWRSLDAQYFGLAQRRERVFIVARLGDWRLAVAVLLEPEGLCGHPAPSREAGSHVAGTLTAGIAGGRGGADDNDAQGHHLVSHCLNAGGMGRRDFETETFVTHTLTAKGFDAGEDGTGRGTPIVPAAFHTNARADEMALTEEKTAPLTCGQSTGVLLGAAVRRLTPTECERLQGFPDGYTAVTYRGKPAADGPRYAALGNSMAVPVMQWIGERIARVSTPRRVGGGA